MNGKHTIEKPRRTKVQRSEPQQTHDSRKPSEYFMDGQYTRYTRTVIAVGLANALVLE